MQRSTLKSFCRHPNWSTRSFACGSSVGRGVLRRIVHQRVPLQWTWQIFLGVPELIRIVCTIPVSSCECERSASALRRLHTWSRASMSQERLSALAMLHIQYDQNIDLSEVVDKFSKKYPRRLELDNLLRWWQGLVPSAKWLNSCHTSSVMKSVASFDRYTSDRF